MNWKDIGLRFVWTVVAAVAGAIGAVEVVNMDIVNAAIIAGITASLSFLVNLTKELMALPSGNTWFARVGLTFLQASAAALVAVPVFNMDGFKSAAMVGLIAAANVLTLVGRQMTDPKPVIGPAATNP